MAKKRIEILIQLCDFILLTLKLDKFNRFPFIHDFTLLQTHFTNTLYKR